MTTELANHNGGAIILAQAPQSWAMVSSLGEAVQLAEIMQKSNLFPDVSSAAQAVVKILMGAEMGFGPMASMKGVQFIEGVPSMGAHLMACKIKGSGKYDYKVHQADRKVCKIEFFEKKAGKLESMGAISLSIEEAVEAGWTVSQKGKDHAGWKRTPDDMLFARVISKGYRRFCPDLTGGVPTYVPEELADTAEWSPRPAVSVETLPATSGQGQAQQAALLGPTEDLITPPQMGRIDDLLVKLGIDHRAAEASLKKNYGVDRFSNLRVAQALELEGKLGARLVEAEAKAKLLATAAPAETPAAT